MVNANSINRLLKTTLLVVLLAIGMLFIIGTGADEEEDEVKFDGNNPAITGVEMLSQKPDSERWEESNVFYVGGKISWNLYTTDKNADIKSFYLIMYYPLDDTEPYNDEKEYHVASHTSTLMTWHPESPLEVTSPTGTWRFEFQTVDQAGNWSNVWVEYGDVENY